MRPQLLVAWLVASCLLGSCSCWRTYHCNSVGRRAIRDERFYIETRNYLYSQYSRGSLCEFGTRAPNSSVMYLVEVQRHEVGNNTTVAISSGYAEMFRGSTFRRTDLALMTFGPQLNVTLDARDDNAQAARGLRLRVQMWKASECPPGWLPIRNGGFIVCVGTSNSPGVLSFADAQRSCNRMRANLLHLPPWFDDDINRLLRVLPASLRQGWVGLMTDVQHRHRYRWLDGSCLTRSRQQVRCGSYSRYGCDPSSRCAALSSYGVAAYRLWHCRTQRAFVCSMPAGGTSNFYELPRVASLSISTWYAWAWSFLLVGFIGLTVLGSVLIVRSRKRRARTAAASPQPGTLPAYTISASVPVKATPPELLPPPYRRTESRADGRQ